MPEVWSMAMASIVSGVSRYWRMRPAGSPNSFLRLISAMEKSCFEWRAPSWRMSGSTDSISLLESPGMWMVM